jgi:hypothetical protein
MQAMFVLAQPANQNTGGWTGYLTIQANQTLTVSGSWVFDPNRPACGAAGVGPTVNDKSFPVPGAPIGCLVFGMTGLGNRQPPAFEGYTGWFTSDVQTITWNNTSPGQENYWFRINDNDTSDNSG